MRNKEFLLIVVLVISVIKICNADDSLSGIEVLRTMISNYSAYDSYQDAGIVTNEFYENDIVTLKSIKHFKTFYNGPAKFRFQWVDESPLMSSMINIVWRNNLIIHSNLENIGYKKFDNMNSSLSAITGLTSGVAYTVPIYLLDEIPCQLLDGVESAVILNSDHPNEVLYKIKITHQNNHSSVIWVDKDKFLLRRMEEWTEGRGLKVKTNIEYLDVKVDVPIKNGTFDFSPKSEIVIDKIKEMDGI